MKLVMSHFLVRSGCLRGPEKIYLKGGYYAMDSYLTKTNTLTYLMLLKMLGVMERVISLSFVFQILEEPLHEERIIIQVQIRMLEPGIQGM